MDVKLSEAKAKLSEIVERAQAGEDVCITRHGKRVIRLVPIEPTEEELQARRDKAWAMIDALRASLPQGTRTPEEIKADYREGLE